MKERGRCSWRSLIRKNPDIPLPALINFKRVFCTTILAIANCSTTGHFQRDEWRYNVGLHPMTTWPKGGHFRQGIGKFPGTWLRGALWSGGFGNFVRPQVFKNEKRSLGISAAFGWNTRL